jgi:hypothetical protein
MALLALAPASALGADFTFRVPVTLSNVPSVTSIRVDCEVWTGAASGGGSLIGTAFTIVPISDGSFSGSVTVEVAASGALTPDQARWYSCWLTAMGHSRTGAEYGASAGSMQAVYESATGTTLTSVRSTVSGPIPR